MPPCTSAGERLLSLIPYGLDGNWCEECGRAKSFRLFPGTLTGCKLCDEVITRHRCTGRPDRDPLDPGESWECPDCGSTWTAIEEADNCGECGQEVWRKTWAVVEGDRIATAPRHEPQPFSPFRSALREIADASFRRPFRNEIRRPGSCYRMGNGSMVHVRPGCRCAR